MKRVIIVSLVFAILATACGVSTETTPVSADAVGNSDPTVNPLLESPTTTTIVATTPSEDSDFPVSFIDSLGEVTIGTKPMAIVSLSPASTEILFAVGAGDQVL
ncbi:MAG: ABC transporter substrate-binding protein, partial [Acidimicrobiia bacterium]|nr:ABC transporter substrate-binding protein [Acidimicrobiia bacterium]